MRGTRSAPDGAARSALILGAVVAGLGVAGVLLATFAGPDDTTPLIALAVGSALLVIFGVAMLSPTIARPFAGALGRPAFATVILALGVLIIGLATLELVQSQRDLWSDPDVLADLRSAMGSQGEDLGDTALRWAITGQALTGLVIGGLAVWVLSLPLLSFTKPQAHLNVWWRRLLRVLAVIVLVVLVIAGFFFSMSGLGMFPFLFAAGPHAAHGGSGRPGYSRVGSHAAMP